MAAHSHYTEQILTKYVCWEVTYNFTFFAQTKLDCAGAAHYRSPQRLGTSISDADVPNSTWINIAKAKVEIMLLELEIRKQV